MSLDLQSKPSFSPRNRWNTALRVSLLVVMALAIVVMLNFLSQDWFRKFHASTRTRIELAPRTIGLLGSITNQVNVTIYYDKDEPLYKDISDLLEEYRLLNPRISVQTVDYLRDAGAAQRVKNLYELSAATEKNLVIFECAGKKKVVDGNALSQYVVEQVPNEKERVFRRKPTAFLGELTFTAALLDVTNPKPFVACFLHGHGEHSMSSGSDYGYLKFAAVFAQNCIQLQPLSLLGTNTVPLECNLLVIAGPTREIHEIELEKIDRYLAQGGRMLALLNSQALDKDNGSDRTGLGKVLAKWGVQAADKIIQDPNNSVRGHDMVVRDFSRQHPVVNPLLLSGLYIVQPRPVGQLKSRPQSADAPQVEEVAFSGPAAVATGDSQPARYPVMAAVEKGALKGVITERGSMRMIVVGDSIFLANAWIESAANRDFAGYAANWLLDRTQLLQGLGPRPITEYKIIMTQNQLRAAQWILLGGMPGAVLVFGGMVWLRRRN